MDKFKNRVSNIGTTVWGNINDGNNIITERSLLEEPFYNNPLFYLTLIVTVLCWFTSIWWVSFRVPVGGANYNSYVLFAHTAPSYAIVMTGVLLDFVSMGLPSAMLICVYSFVGTILFVVIALIQLYNVDLFPGKRGHVRFLSYLNFATFAALLILTCVAMNAPTRRIIAVIELDEDGRPRYSTEKRLRKFGVNRNVRKDRLGDDRI